MKLFKKGQLAIIEMKFLFIGLLVGLLAGLALIYLGTKKILPFEIPMVCGSALFMNKKGQLGIIEFKYFFVGLIIGLILAAALVYLGTAKILPFSIPLVCG